MENGASSPSINDDMIDFEQFCATRNYQKDCWLPLGLDKGSTGRLCLILLTCFWCLCCILYLVFTVCCTLCYLYLMSCWPRFLSAFVWSCDWQSKARSEIPLQSISLFLLLLQFMVHPKNTIKTLSFKNPNLSIF
jgi:hypothetical protein